MKDNACAGKTMTSVSSRPPLHVPRLLWGGEERGSLFKVPFHTYVTAKRRYLRLKPYEGSDSDGGSSPPCWINVSLVDNLSLDLINQKVCIVKASSPLALVWNDPRLSPVSSLSPLKKMASRDTNSNNDRELLLEDIIQFVDGKRTAAFKAYIAKNGNWSVPHESQCFSLVTVKRTFDFFVRKNDVGATNNAIHGCEEDANMATVWKDAIQMLLDSVHRWDRNGSQQRQQQQISSLPKTRHLWDSTFHRATLFDAAKCRDIGTLKWYFDNGCPVDLMDAASGDTVLMIACRLGHLDVAQLALLEYQGELQEQIHVSYRNFHLICVPFTFKSTK